MSINDTQTTLERIPAIGFVVIGRNEGERLRRCISSILEQSIALRRTAGSDTPPTQNNEVAVNPIVYVDSGSTDGSVEFVRSVGCEVVVLNDAIAFTAARARNTGLAHLIQKHPDVEWVQFVDGDCSLQPGWLSKSAAFLSINPQVAIVCGRRREVYPQKTIYNALCDMEWDTPVGEARACGGDFLARRTALESVNAFNPNMIAGEEPEMCFRLRKESWKIWRIAEEMTSHDAAMMSFRQFWLRNVRAGFAYAERCAMHATKRHPYCVREVVSICLWAFVIPLFALVLGALSPIASLLVLGVYPAMALRIFLRRLKLRRLLRRSLVYSVLIPLGKFPQFWGVVRYAVSQLSGRRTAIIEYK